MNFENGLNEGRFPNTLNIESNPARLEEAMSKACQLVDSTDGRSDFHVLEERLRNACSWNKKEEVVEILRTCYVTKEIAISALKEASLLGHIGIVRILLDAGTPGAEHGQGSSKNALHVACENGHEDICRLLISYMRSNHEVMALTLDARSCTAFEILRSNDMGMAAKRLESFALETLESETSRESKGTEQAFQAAVWLNSKEGRLEMRLFRSFMMPPVLCLLVLSAVHALRFGVPLQDIGQPDIGVHRGWVSAIVQTIDNLEFRGTASPNQEQAQHSVMLNLLDCKSAAPLTHARLAKSVLKYVGSKQE